MKRNKVNLADPMRRATKLSQMGFCLGLGSLAMVYIFLVFIGFAIDTMEGKDAVYVSMFFVTLAIGSLHYWWHCLRHAEPALCAARRPTWLYLHGVAATLTIGGDGSLAASLLLFFLNGRRYRLSSVMTTERVGLIALYCGFVLYLVLYAVDVAALRRSKAEQETATAEEVHSETAQPV